MSDETARLKRNKNRLLREAIGCFIAPLIVPIMLLAYDFSPTVNIIFITVAGITAPLLGLILLRQYFKIKKKYEISLN